MCSNRVNLVQKARQQPGVHLAGDPLIPRSEVVHIVEEQQDVLVGVVRRLQRCSDAPYHIER